MSYKPNADAREASKDLPPAERAFYLNLDRWANTLFQNTPRSLLDTLVEECKTLRYSKVDFPTNDERLVRSLGDDIGYDNRKDWGEWTFGYVARGMKPFLLIDIEEGNYRGSSKIEVERLRGEI